VREIFYSPVFSLEDFFTDAEDVFFFAADLVLFFFDFSLATCFVGVKCWVSSGKTTVTRSTFKGTMGKV
jgi:hypothetical protein